MRSKPILLTLLFLLSGGLLLALSAAMPADASAADGFVSPRLSTQRFFATDAALSGRDDVTLLADYGSYGLYETSSATLSSLLEQNHGGRVWLDFDANILQFDVYPLNTQQGSFDFPEPFKATIPEGPALHLVQFAGPIQEVWLEMVSETGAVPIHYIDSYGYLLWADDAARQELNGMVGSRSVLQFSAPYQTYFKLGDSLRDRITRGSDGTELVEVTVQMVRHANQAATESFIADAAAAVHTAWTPILNYQNVQITVPAARLLAIAERPDVYWLGERFERELHDEVQGQIVAGNFDASQSGPEAPGYLAWLDSYGVSQDPADYPVVDIVDDGIGNGTAANGAGDPTLTYLANGTTTRLAYIENCTSESSGEGIGGHGHINASIAGGYDIRSGFPFTDPLGYRRGQGINPYGRFAGTRIFDPFGFDLSNCGGTDTALIQSQQDSGAKISSNSWGCSGCAGSYDDSSQAFDVGTRDADLNEAGNQGILFVFSAGNSGPTGGTIGTPGNGKNMLTVGASENDRPTDEDGNWTDGCNVGPSGADDAMDVIGFSSRGPAPGNRVKPEIIAPGTHIQGTASTSPNYDGTVVCDQYRPSGQTTYASSSGTSHSAPAVAGVSSIYYHWLESQYGMTTPSPALVKAYVTAHTTYLTGVSANDTLPSNVQGYGMPDMSVGLDDTPRYMVDQSVILDSSGESWTFSGSVADPSKPVYIIMTYTDQAGAIGTSPQVNDLNLDATVGGTAYVGNNFSGRYSVAGGTPDEDNNYEAIFLPAGTAGSLEVTITGFNIAGDGVPNSGDDTDQDFALVCYNCAQFPDFALTSEPTTQSICAPADAQYTLSVSQILGYDDPVTLSASGHPAGTTTNFSTNPVTPAEPANTSTLTVGNTGAAAAGSYAIDVVGVAPTSTHTTTVGLDLYTAVPGAPVLQTPPDGASNQPQATQFTWNAASQGATYGIEIATDSGFTNVVESASGLNDTTYMAAGLDSNTRYYWRVWSGNTCGTGSYSAVFEFITEPLPGDCTFGTIPLTVAEEDFESGASGWSSGGTNDTWVLSSDRVNSGAFSYYAEDLPEVSDQYLYSPAYDLPSSAFGPITLQFWNWQEIEDRAGGCFDGGMVEISTNGGTSWSQIGNGSMLTDPYDGPIDGGFDNPAAGQDAWCGDPQDWLNSVVDLDDYAGQTVEFRFRLATDRSVGKEGWYIDDLEIQACAPASDYFAILSPAESVGETLPGTTITHTFRLDNAGQLDDSYNLAVTGADWPTALEIGSPVAVPNGGGVDVPVSVEVPHTPWASDVFTLTASSVNSPTIVVTSTGTTTAVVNPGMEIPGDMSDIGDPGETMTYTVTITNSGDYTDTFTVLVDGNVWDTGTSHGDTGPLGAGESMTMEVYVTIGDGLSDSAVVSFTSTLNPLLTESMTITTYAWQKRYLPTIVRP